MAEKSSNALLWVIGIILVLLGIIYFATADQLPEDGSHVVEEPIKIGVIVPLSGDASVYGTVMQRSYELAVEEINEAGGIHDRQIELIYEDGKCDADAAFVAAQTLIENEGVKYILGGVCSGETLGIAKATEEAGVLLLSPSATSPQITEAGDLVFRTYPSDAVGGIQAAEYAVEELGASRVAVIYEETAFAEGVYEAFIETAEDLDARVVFDESFETGETNFRSLASRLRRIRTDVVYLIPEDAVSGEILLKKLRDTGVRATFIGAQTLFDRDAFEAEPKTYRDVLFEELSFDVESEKTAELMQAYEDKYGRVPSYASFTASAYDNVYLLAGALEESEGEPTDVAEYLLELSDWEGTLGTINFDKNGDVLLEMNFVEVQRDGSVEIVE